jgi:hypothetical protein
MGPTHLLNRLTNGKGSLLTPYASPFFSPSGIFVGMEDGFLSTLSTPCVRNRSVRFPEQGMAWKIPGASTPIDQSGRLQIRRISFWRGF